VNYISTLTRNKEIIKYHAGQMWVHGLLLGPPEEDIFGLFGIHTEILSEFVITILVPMVCSKCGRLSNMFSAYK